MLKSQFQIKHLKLNLLTILIHLKAKHVFKLKYKGLGWKKMWKFQTKTLRMKYLSLAVSQLRVCVLGIVHLMGDYILTLRRTVPIHRKSKDTSNAHFLCALLYYFQFKVCIASTLLRLQCRKMFCISLLFFFLRQKFI